MKSIRIHLSILVLLGAARAATAQVTAIRAGLLVDPAAGTAARDQVILVEKGSWLSKNPIRRIFGSRYP